MNLFRRRSNNSSNERAIAAQEEANRTAVENAERTRQATLVANNRQLAEARRADNRTGLTRRRKRGRRLFAEASENQLNSTLG